MLLWLRGHEILERAANAVQDAGVDPAKPLDDQGLRERVELVHAHLTGMVQPTLFQVRCGYREALISGLGIRGHRHDDHVERLPVVRIAGKDNDGSPLL